MKRYWGVIVIYLAVAGACEERVVNSGNAAITIATAATGNHNNAVRFAIFNEVSGDLDGASQGTATVYDGTNSTLGTATSPTRTTQSFSIAATDLRDGAFFNGTGSLQAAEAPVCIGAFIRHNGSNASNFKLEVGSVVSDNLTNSSIVMRRNNHDFNQVQDSTSFTINPPTRKGGSHNINVGQGSLTHFMPIITLSGKSGNVPQSGDSFTVRITASATVDGAAVTAIHDLTINLT